ncbi:hypothetical protein FCL48_24570 [Desulforhopalus sp. IMCC35007]|nr:hypothetical protein FCL48_24570 [Desulforhopalus sp. IMCC35007]
MSQPKADSRTKPIRGLVVDHITYRLSTHLQLFRPKN